MALDSTTKADLVARLNALVTYVNGLPLTQPPPPPSMKLTPSGSITVTANNQVIENKLITGTISISAKSGVIIRNCQINHPSGEAIAATNCTNLTIQDCKIINTSAKTGLAPNADDESKSIFLNGGGPFTIQRVYVEGSGAGIYAYQTTGKINVSFFEGHKARGGQGNRGQLIQFNLCSGGAQMEDFSTENPMTDSWTADNLNLFQCSGTYIFRRGLIDGNNHPAGCGIMLESTSGVLVEDVDMIRMQNGGPGCFSGAAQPGVPGVSANTVFRRIRVRDTVQQDIGRGPAQSGWTTFVSSPGCINTQFLQCNYWNVNKAELFWDASTMTARDCTEVNFTPRSPIRNVFNWS